MVKFLLLTKSHDAYDFDCWYKYHKHLVPGAQFVILDNESTVNLYDRVSKNDIIIPVEGFPDQHNLYNRVFNEMNIFKDGDFIIICDDDEYIYFHDKNDPMDTVFIEDVLRKCDKDNLVIPQVLVSTNEVLQQRIPNVPITITHCYRRNDVATTGKSIIRYNHKSNYDFTYTPANGARGHVPSIDGKVEAYCFTWWKKQGTVDCEVLTFRLGDPPFAQVDYNNNIRLYHYHIKSRKEWDIKIARGSCALKVPWYKDKLEDNIFYGGYDTLDTDMKDLYERNA